MACARHVGAPFIVADLQKLNNPQNRRNGSIFEKADTRAKDTDVTGSGSR